MLERSRVVDVQARAERAVKEARMAIEKIRYSVNEDIVQLQSDTSHRQGED